MFFMILMLLGREKYNKAAEQAMGRVLNWRWICSILIAAIMLSPHPSTALEYWFFKVNAGPVALIVDWITYRRRNENVLRVSIHSDHERTVLFDRLPSPMIEGQNFLTMQQTVGQLSDIAWALDIECDDQRIEPDVFPANLLRMSDLILVSAPAARFTGWIRHGPLQFDL